MTRNDPRHTRWWLDLMGAWQRTGFKRCTGPLHPEGGEMLPCSRDGESAFQFYREGSLRPGRPLSRCARCTRYAANKNPDGGYVKLEEFKPIFVQLVKRIGYIETLRRIGMSTNMLYRLRTGNQRQVQMSTFKRVKAALDHAKLRGERRHPRDIQHGTNARGKREHRLKLRSAFSPKLRDAYYAK